ncbi:hypothetical protein QVG61_09550 [Thiohalobacter sp. IOR34]|uniref:hypothetical protein n=1 Tax=Thiohalobacter sp. IOR34 TaxID=3057176 RepID=UPI0025B2766D|nr:hypothetical protein [Thiohalobacter sp. IOR34]WJW74743.1 hypothetical protein QVG61_09550 [Thiohalobacter sp. IOR34]
MDKKRFKLALLAGIPALAVMQGANAEVRWSGFVNAVGSVTDSEAVYLADEGSIDERGSFEETTFGLSVSADVASNLSVAGQLAIEPGGENIVLDWGFASFRLSDAVSIKAGRNKYAGSLVSEYHDVGYSYPWIRPPEVVYSDDMAAPNMGLVSYDGAAAVFEGYGDESEYSVQIYAGGRSTDAMDFDKMYGFVGKLSNDYASIQAGMNWSTMSTDTTNAMMAVFDDKPMVVASVGGTLDWNDIVGYAEYARSQSDYLDASSNTRTVDIDAWYATLGHRFGKVMPHVTYQSLKHSNGGLEQTSVMVGLRYEVASAAALKLEWQRIKPEVAASASNLPMMLKSQYGLFERGDTPKDEVDMFSIALNLVF